MKIIVNNENEKKLMEEFMDLLWEWGLETLEDDDHGSAFVEMEGYRILKSDTNLNGTKVEIDNEEPEMTLYETDFVNGYCVTCGEYWEGFPEGYELAYKGFRELDNSNLKCEDCYGKEEES